ncbi:MAG: hypothetical protein K2R98_24730 [Gemmataceae bacterium]|nr:hypothetical protein [Gemmataceae bacterium]
MARADGGTVRLSERRGDLQITVFTSPTPWRAGPVDVSVLVQDAATGDPVPDAAVEIRLSPRDSHSAAIRGLATKDVATNKLFVAAQFDLPHAGSWQLDIYIEQNGERQALGCELEAAEASPAWLSLIGWIFWPLLPILAFAMHQYLVWRRRNFRVDDLAPEQNGAAVLGPVR